MSRKRASLPSASEASPPRKKAKRVCHFQDSWTELFPGIKKSSKGDLYARCTYCSSDFLVSHGGKSDVSTHVAGTEHKKAFASSTTSRSILSMFNAGNSNQQIEAEVRWSMFVAKHNLAFLTSDHANKLFRKMFPDSKLAENFACGRTKITSIVKEALSPHYLKSVVDSMTFPFSLMMDESNDKTDKSCIILVRTVDGQCGEVRTRFLDMPVVNIGTAENLFHALKGSLAKHGLDFSKAMAFMSDTTNVMKGMRSRVQKLIRDDNPSVYDVVCICHLTDLTVKAGMKALSIDIDQLFIDVFYHFFHSSKRKEVFCKTWRDLFTSEPDVILKHCPTPWLSLLQCVDQYIGQLPGLIAYFSSTDENSAKNHLILQRLTNTWTLPLLQFSPSYCQR